MSKISPFDFINNICQSKDDLIVDTDTEKQYNPYLINRGLSFGADTIIYANEMNSRPHIEKKLQYDFLRTAMPKKKRYNKWIKADNDENIELVSEYYGYSMERAKEALSLLNDDNLEYIRQKLFKGGKI